MVIEIIDQEDDWPLMEKFILKNLSHFALSKSNSIVIIVIDIRMQKS